MGKIRVTAPMGAVIRGPAILQLTPEQYSARAHQFGKKQKKGIYSVSGDAALTFKCGEEIDVLEGMSKLNPLLFAEVLPDDEIELVDRKDAEPSGTAGSGAGADQSGQGTGGDAPSQGDMLAGDGAAK